MMKETLELRINHDFADLLFKVNEGKSIGSSVKVVDLSREDPRYDQVPIMEKKIRQNFGRGFILGWKIIRSYSKKEINQANLFHLRIKTVFEPSGEECGTLYDEMEACDSCGANRKQLSPLTLKKGSIPRKDIAKTIAGEIVVSSKFVKLVNKNNLKGLILTPVIYRNSTSDYYQLQTDIEVNLSKNVLVGVDPWDFSSNSKGDTFNISGYHLKFEKEIYNCPKGDTLGLNLISEPVVLNSSLINEYDFLKSKQCIGVKRGLLRPEPVLFCSPTLRKIVNEEKLTGFEFEIARLE